MSKSNDLLSWQINNPSNRQDILPQPYRMIDQVLKQTILYKLQLSMHHIQQKKKDQNYQGRVQQYIAQSLIDTDHDICCLSSTPKYQNYLITGDRKGNILILDIAKKSVYCRKQLTPGKRIIYICETTLFDGQTYITLCATISNDSNKIKILRSKHNDPKVHIACEVVVTQSEEDVNKFPYECKLEDDGRLLVVKTFDGTIQGYCLPEMRLDTEKIKEKMAVSQTVLNASNNIKKATIYPLQSVSLDKYHEGKITQKLFQIKFDGYQKPLKYKDLLNKLKNKSKPSQNEPVQTNSKKDSKKDSKKVQVPVTQAVKQPQKQILLNQKLVKKHPSISNNNDTSEPYKIPNYEPFFYILYTQIEFPRKKSFQKGKNIKMASSIIYGWLNTKQVYSISLLAQNKPKFQHISLYQQFLFTQISLTQDQISLLQLEYKKSFSPKLSNKFHHVVHKTIYPITCSNISMSDMTHLALGLQDGTIAIYDSKMLTLQFNTEKHATKVTKVDFFENGWKVISGSDNGEVHINNLIEQKSQVKRTQTFQAKEKTSIIDIKVNHQIGVAYVIDTKSNVRIYDLWRNEKISRFSPCNSFSMAQGKGKCWIPLQSTIYTNKDYSILLSIPWPNLPNDKSVQIPKQLLSKVTQLTANPWISPQINVHAVRNFQFLLQSFDGLQTIYKKGYQKAKVLNLFTNLEFSQLYDRNFDVPDFGRNVNINSHGNNATLVRSKLSYTSKFSNSGQMKKSLPRQKEPSGKQTQSPTQNVKLTSQVLHPQKFLFQRRKVIDPMKSLPTSNQKLIQTIREQHKKKERRANILQDQLNRTSGGI